MKLLYKMVRWDERRVRVFLARSFSFFGRAIIEIAICQFSSLVALDHVFQDYEIRSCNKNTSDHKSPKSVRR